MEVIKESVSDRTALIDFMDLVEKRVIVAKGTKKYRYYIHYIDNINILKLL